MPRFRTILVLALCLLAAAVADLRAQSGAGFPMGIHGPDRPRVDDTVVATTGAGYGILGGRPRVRVSRTDTPPEIDGRLDDEVWRTAAMLSEFVQQSPLDGAPATEETEIYISYDSDHIYFAFYLHYSDPGIMRANRVDRDTAWQDDLMTVYLDTFMDQQVCYDFDLNGYNVQGDGIINASQTRGGPIPIADRSWEALFYSGTQIVEDGYTAEMAIPFKSFRYPARPPGVEHRWGFQFVREIKGKNQENVVWAPMSRDVQSFMAQMGVLEGMTDLSTSRNLEILPSFTAIQYSSLDRETGDFVNRGTDPEGGVNVKYGITSNLTADFTGNPDFSQIESDLPQIEVNQRFPLFFPELRPFFLEGAEIFEFVSPVDLVHTRTLVDPNVGAKLTGKVGNTTLGVMVTDDEAPGKRDDPNDPGFGRNAQVAIGRARYDLYSESHIGVLATDREFLDGYNRVGGIDGQFRLGQATRFNFVAFRSQDRDEQGVQREGPMLGAMVAHEGRHLQARMFGARIDPDFRTDVGFLQRVDQQLGGANVGYRWWPESWLISWGPDPGLPAQLHPRGHPGGRDHRCRAELRLRPEHQRQRQRHSGARTVRGRRLRPPQLQPLHVHQHQPPVLARRQLPVGGRDLLHRPAEPVPGARQQRVAVRHHPALSAVVVAAQPRHQPLLRRPQRQSRGVQRAGPAGAVDVHVHRPPAAAQHHRVQLVPGHAGDEPAVHLSRQCAHGVLRRLR